MSIPLAKDNGKRRRSLLWYRILTGAIAVAATGGMATATVWQLAVMSPAAATSPSFTRSQPGGGSPPLYPDAPTVIPDTRPVPFEDAGGKGHKNSAAEPLLRSVPAVYGIPGRVLEAYRGAVRALASESPQCGIPMPLLAAIGRVESGHARGGALDARGRTRSPILGPRLDGSPGVAAIHDTDNGAWDGDRTWDRAVGPAQFIPSTWRRWGSDGNHDGVADPHQIDDAWLAAGRYLCQAGGDLTRDEGIRRAVLAYNHSDAYLELVLSWMRVYSDQAVPTTGEPAADIPSTHTPDRKEKGKESGKGSKGAKEGKGGKKPKPSTIPSPDSSPSDDKSSPKAPPPGAPTKPPNPLPTLTLHPPGFTPSAPFPSARTS
ncbi:lytic transglycosylase [Streptomyces antnestii]|uniref:Lytic transglycosylase n=1 Tax=Streptomyces antnestii TaxID=2494256 RepID=A0A3S2YZ79_9ACTN|nr:lytic transglycosylase domain-containing protein [Streptomyces sp. San01]RVU23027.1 lytic transglycosylase [Streptomyces sp. San01]